MQTYLASCHCGGVKFKIKTTLDYCVICDCSLCQRRGATMVRCHEDDLEIVEGKEHLSLYQFNSNIAQHYFCKHCGIYTFHKMKKLPNQFGVNAGCLEGVNSLELVPVLTEGSKR